MRMPVSDCCYTPQVIDTLKAPGSKRQTATNVGRLQETFHAIKEFLGVVRTKPLFGSATARSLV